MSIKSDFGEDIKDWIITKEININKRRLDQLSDIKLLPPNISPKSFPI